MATIAGKTNRFMELEGLRGVAALMVFVFHFLIVFYPVMFYGHSSILAPIQHMRFENNIHGTPLGSLVSGSFAVAIFFILSGFVLSIGFFATKNESIIRRLAIKRYPRLMLPALASVLLVWIYISLNLSHTMDARTITMSGALPLNWTAHPASLFGALQEGIVSIFTTGAVDNYNSVLWTMRFEFAGSFVVFLVATIFGQSNKRWIVYSALAIGLYNTWFIGFILGMALADLYSNGQALLIKIQRLRFLYPLLAIGVILGGYPIATVAGTLYQYVSLPWLPIDENQSFIATIGALCVVTVVLLHPGIRKFMASRMVSNFGKYTYSFYLVHQPIIYTLGMGLFVVLTHYFGYNTSVLLTILCTIPVVAIVTRLFFAYIEQPSVRLAAYFEQIYSNEKSFSLTHIHGKVKMMIAKLRTAMHRQTETELEIE